MQEHAHLVDDEHMWCNVWLMPCDVAAMMIWWYACDLVTYDVMNNDWMYVRTWMCLPWWCDGMDE